MDATLAEDGLVTRLVTREFQFDELCGLRQTAVSWAVYCLQHAAC